MSPLRAIGGDEEMNCIVHQTPFNDHGHSIAKLDQTFRSGFRIVLDDHAAAWIPMAIGEYETHAPL
jgi:hypothetical protein